RRLGPPSPGAQHMRIEEAPRTTLEEVDLIVIPARLLFPLDGDDSAWLANPRQKRRLVRPHQENCDRRNEFGLIARSPVRLETIPVERQAVTGARERDEEQAFLLL